MIISEYVAEHIATHPANLMEELQITAICIDSVREFHAWSAIKSQADIEHAHIDAGTLITDSEWGVIKPLFNLQVEFQQALLQEASRVVGHDVYGRSSSEIQQDIETYRRDYFRQWAFDETPFTMAAAIDTDASYEVTTSGTIFSSINW